MNDTRSTPPHSAPDIVSKIRKALEDGISHAGYDCQTAEQRYARTNNLSAAGVLAIRATSYRDLAFRLTEALSLLPQLETMLEKEPVELEKAFNDYSYGTAKWRNQRDIVHDNPPMHKEEIKAGLKEVFEAAGVPYAE